MCRRRNYFAQYLRIPRAHVSPPLRVHGLHGHRRPRARASGNPGAAASRLQPARKLAGPARRVAVDRLREVAFAGQIRRCLSAAVALQRVRAIGAEHPRILAGPRLLRRDVQGRSTSRVGCVHVGAASEQERAALEGVDGALGRVQRRLAVTIAALADGRARGAAPVERLPVGKLAGRAERLFGMLAVVVGVDVRPVGEQPGHHRHIAGLGGHVQERVAIHSHVEVGVEVVECFGKLDGPAGHDLVHHRPASPPGAAVVRPAALWHHRHRREIRVALERAPHCRGVFRPDAREEPVGAQVAADDEKRDAEDSNPAGQKDDAPETPHQSCSMCAKRLMSSLVEYSPTSLFGGALPFRSRCRRGRAIAEGGDPGSSPGFAISSI